MEKKQLVKLLSHVADIYRQFEFPKETSNDTKRFVESWREYVGEYDYEVGREAVQKFAGNNPKWPPNAPELKNICENIVEREKRIEWERKQEKLMEQEEQPKLGGGQND